MDGLQGFAEIDLAKFLAERRGAETEHGQLQSCFAQVAELHEGLSPVAEGHRTLPGDGGA